MSIQNFFIRKQIPVEKICEFLDIEDTIMLFPDHGKFPDIKIFIHGIMFAAKYGNKQLVDYFITRGGDLDYALAGALLRALIYKNKDMLEYIVLKNVNVNNAFNYLLGKSSIIQSDRDSDKINDNIIIKLSKLLIRKFDADINNAFRSATIGIFSPEINEFIIKIFYIYNFEQICHIIENGRDHVSDKKLDELYNFIADLDNLFFL